MTAPIPARCTAPTLVRVGAPGLVLAALMTACPATHPTDSMADLLAAVPPAPVQVPDAPTQPETRTVTAAAPRCPEDRAPATGAHGFTRADARALVDHGFGHFLARIDVSPVLSHGRFVGFRLECATDLAAWTAAGADVRVGDVITRVNGRSIELPDAALAVFESLRTAPEVSVDLLRDGTPVTVRHAIPDDPAVTPAR